MPVINGMPLPPAPPFHPISDAITGINNIINTATQAATSFLQASTIPVKSNLQVYSPQPTYPPPIQLSGLYGYGTNPSAPITQTTVQYVQPIQTFNYVQDTRQPISVTIQPQPITVNVPSAPTQVLGPFLPFIEQALAPIVSTLGQVINPLIRMANTASGGEFTNLSSLVNKVTYDATNTFRELVNGAKTDLQKQIDAANRSTSERLREASVTIEEAKIKLGRDFVDERALFNKNFMALSEDLHGYIDRVAEQNRKNAEQLRKIEADNEANKASVQAGVLAKADDAFTDILRFLNNPDAAIKGLINKALPDIAGFVLSGIKPTITAYDNLLADLKAGKIKDTTDLLDRIKAAGGSTELIAQLINIISVFSLIVRGIFITANPWLERIEQLVNAENKQNLLTADQYIEYIKRLPAQSLWSFNQLHKLGLNDEQIAVIFENGGQLLNAEQLIAADLRGIITNKDYTSGLNKLGYDDKQQKIINQLRLIIPPVQDIITMAVREVFTPELRKSLSLDSEFPDDFGKFAYQQGLSLDWAHNYWAMHWQLPSPEQVFEMLHRRKYDARLGDVDENFVNAYLKVNDYAPVWRDKLAAISYNTPTRVDIRRMYKAGVFNDIQMHNAHLALGLSETDANFLDDYVRRTSLPEDETDLDKIKTRIEHLLENRYIAGAIDEKTLRDYMQSIGRTNEYTNQAVPLFNMEKYISGLENEAENIKQRSITAVISARQRGNISRTIAKRQLIALGLSEVQAEQSTIYADLQYTIRLKEKAQDVYQRQYALHNMEAPEFRTALEGYEFSADEISRALLEAELMRADKSKKLSQSQLQKLRSAGIISEETYLKELSNQGLTGQSVTWLALLAEKESSEQLEQ